jgi:hypothetical protein
VKTAFEDQARASQQPAEATNPPYAEMLERRPAPVYGARHLVKPANSTGMPDIDRFFSPALFGI